MYTYLKLNLVHWLISCLNYSLYGLLDANCNANLNLI